MLALSPIELRYAQSKDHAARVYYDRKRAEGKNYRSAFRCVKRRLATVVYYRLCETQHRLDARLTVAA